MPTSLGSYLRQLIKLVRASLSPRLKKAWIFLGLLLLLGAFFDFLALGALVPFLEVISRGAATPSPQFTRFAAVLGLAASSKPLTVILGVGLAGIILVNASLKTLSIYLSGRVTAGIGTQLARRCFANSLYQSYERHTLANSAELITRIARVDLLVGGVLQPLFQSSAAVLTLVVTLSGMLIFQPTATLLIALMVGSAFALCNRLARNRLRWIGGELSWMGVHLTKLLQQSSASFRELKLFGLEPIVLDDFIQTDYRGRLLGQESSFLGAAPKLVIEGIGLAVLILASVLLTISTSGGNPILTIGFIVYGFQKLLPAAQQLFACSSSLKSNGYVIDDIARTLMDDPARNAQYLTPLQPSGKSQQASDFCDFESLECRQVCYHYPGQLKGIGPIDLMLRRGEMLGLVGATGSGKSTLIDLIMGLLNPSSGQIMVNGACLQWNDLTQTADPNWTSQISHVPQRLYLHDGSIVENICLTTDRDSIDTDRLRQAIELSCLQSTIDDLPAGLDTAVGEAGIRLSGGQCQRIGLARSLYRGGNLLILDEATSALDRHTESQVMEGLRSLPGLTIISIAHRLISLESADKIVCFDKPGGPLSLIGYDQLINPAP
jgi:ABC-type multidrug transport system fused ATPase/permease subunit